MSKCYRKNANHGRKSAMARNFKCSECPAKFAMEWAFDNHKKKHKEGWVYRK